MSQYLDNPHWEAMYKYSMGPPNGGHYKRWIQGSVGMMEPMPLYSNEYAHTYMKHGQNDMNPYRGNIKSFAPSVTEDLKRQVNQCTSDTINPAGCQNAAVRKVYTNDSNPTVASRQISSGAAPRGTNLSPHPYEVSYRTGYSPAEVYIAPNGRIG